LCLAIPMKIEDIKWPMAIVSHQGLVKKIDIQLVPTVKKGDYVLVHGGFAIQTLDTNIARESIDIWESLGF